LAKQIVNIGTNPNDGTGDPLRTGMNKINQNFTDLYDNYQSLAGLAANVVTKTANNTLYVGVTPSASIVNSTSLAANLENYVSASVLSSYQTLAGLSANVVKITANNSNYLGGVIAENYLTTSLASSLYQTQAGMAANVSTLTSNNSAYLNGKLEAALNVNNATTAYGKTENKLSVNNAAYAFGKSEIDLNVNNATTAYGKTEGNLNVNNATYVYGKTEGNLNVNNATYVYGKTQDNLNVNAASYAVAAYSNQFTVGTSTYFVTNGNIGFGTATPEVKISVKGSRNDTNGYGWFTFSDQGTSNKIGMRVDTNNGFWIDYFNGGSWGVHMGILASGNVGISNTSPGSKLTVGGRIETTTGGIKFPDGTTQTTAAVSYTLPSASGSTLGGVKVGTGLDITSGTLSVTSAPYATTAGSSYTFGGIGTHILANSLYGDEINGATLPANPYSGAHYLGTWKAVGVEFPSGDTVAIYVRIS